MVNHMNLSADGRMALLDARQYILSHPGEIMMGDWVGHSPCGTTACIAGHLVSRSKHLSLETLKVVSEGRIMSVHQEALKLLFPDYMEEDFSDTLFFSFTWPNDLRGKYHKAVAGLFDVETEPLEIRLDRASRVAEVVVERIDLLLEQGI